MPDIIYIIVAFITGLILAWAIVYSKLIKVRKELKSTQGFLESEKLMKETVQKELAVTHQNKMAAELDLSIKLQEAEKMMQQMDSDILLLQKSNEETEALLEAKQPEVHAIKLQLIEAQNIAARYKAQLREKRK
jgi:biopolymer transport protein ExbB/TolQ